MKNKYRVTYISATEGSSLSYCDSYDSFELALEQYNHVTSLFDVFADVKLTVETLVMQRA